MTNLATYGSYADVGGSALSMRNRIINGGMGIDQRNSGSSQTFTAAAALAYSVDRWYGYCTGANVTGQRVAGSGSTQYRYQFTGAASVTAIGFGQRIEAANSYSLAGQTATLAVDISNSLLTSVTWTAYYANTTDTFGTLASPTKTQIATGTFTVSSTLTRYQTQISVPAAATTGIEVLFTVAAQTSGTWVIGNVQLESGSVATPFEFRPIGYELSLCQRYYNYVQGSSQTPTVTGLGVTTTVVSCNAKFPVTMRATPSATVYSYNNTANKIAVFASATDVGTNVIVTTALINQYGFVELNDSSAPFSASQQYWFWYTANAEL
jgi:hypothetical protein